jgi:hypothetical protein
MSCQHELVNGFIFDHLDIVRVAVQSPDAELKDFQLVTDYSCLNS